jgi:hypothetical protein
MFSIRAMLAGMDTNTNDDKIIGYCVKCKEKREMKDVQKVEIKPGRPAAKGTCTVCGTGMYKILPKSAA